MGMLHFPCFQLKLKDLQQRKPRNQEPSLQEWKTYVTKRIKKKLHLGSWRSSFAAAEKERKREIETVKLKNQKEQFPWQRSTSKIKRGFFTEPWKECKINQRRRWDLEHSHKGRIPLLKRSGWVGWQNNGHLFFYSKKDGEPEAQNIKKREKLKN